MKTFSCFYCKIEKSGEGDYRSLGFNPISSAPPCGCFNDMWIFLCGKCSREKIKQQNYPIAARKFIKNHYIECHSSIDVV